MSSKWCAYFSETEPKEYSFLNFYKYRSKQVDFTFSFQKESYKLQMDFDNLEKDGLEESKKTSKGALIATVTMECCLPYGQNVRYWKMEPLQLRWTMECCLPYGQNGHRDTFCDVNAFWNKIELNGQLQDQLQTAEIEAVSSLISVSKKTFATTIRNVHSAIENVNDTLDEIDTFFQGPPNVVKDASRKRRSVKGTGSKSVKRNKSSKKIVVDAGNHPVPSMNIQRTSTIFNTDDAIVDVGQTTCDESELPVEAEKAEKSKTIFSWEHVVDKLKISDKSDHDVLG
ncbi:unnamed protein product [Rhizophagus irregularis]|uniref:Uncharacterized protein n=1 Tax=Rhizophagus irregularis TaxID=588596 RepID=A0A915ZYN3_9GLOM|nr:unnamed protein product [Rhizophagus irregularis]CAB5188848.1 unnamed protein product [Rhizophagus irregularis]CAB5396124.1 unnamed protein product [Rhizophagus irregularis]